MFNSFIPLNLYSNFKKAAEQFPQTAIYFDEELTAFPELGLETTYARCASAIQVKARQLAKKGVQKNDKIIIYKSAKFDSYLLAVAATYLGAIPAMISPHLSPQTMDVLVERLDLPWLIYDNATETKVKQLSNLSANKCIPIHELLMLSPLSNYQQVQLFNDAISYMTHTSGTTGIPKLIAHSANSMGWRVKWQKNILSLMRKRGLVAFHISPVHSRFNIGISALMAKGFPLFPVANPNRANVIHIMQTAKPYIVETHPNHFVQWAQIARESPEVFSSVRFYHSTFDAINKETMATFLRTSQHKRPVFLQVYGQSECGPMIMRFHTLKSLSKANARVMGLGMPKLTKVRIVDKDGNPVPTGTPGNIQMFSKGRAITYFKEENRFRDNVYGKWWDSGDYGVKDKWGILSLHDRQIDLVDSIESTLAIEDQLLDTLPFLAEVVIIRGNNGSPQPIIATNKGQEIDWDDWYEKVSDLPHLNEPIVISYEQIPRTATMKVQRLELERALKRSLEQGIFYER